MDYAGVSQYLGARQSRNVKGKIATSINRLDEDTIVLRYHYTDIVTWSPGQVTINSGGWQTTTTKRRMNNWLPQVIRVWQTDWVWNVHINGLIIPFKDGITFRQENHGVWLLAK